VVVSKDVVVDDVEVINVVDVVVSAIALVATTTLVNDPTTIARDSKGRMEENYNVRSVTAVSSL
jgi:uncharacterized membrane protein